MGKVGLDLVGRFPALAVLILVTALVVAACGGDDKKDGGVLTPTATVPATVPTTVPGTIPAAVTPTVSAGASIDCPVEAVVCEFATSIDEWIQGGDVELIVASTRSKEFECPGPSPSGLGGPFPLCDGSTKGERRVGHEVLRRHSEGSVIQEAELGPFLRRVLADASSAASDRFGPGNYILYSVGCRGTKGGEASSCSEKFTVVFSGIHDGQRREVLAFFAELSGETSIIVQTWTGVIPDTERGLILRDGGDVFDLGFIHPIVPSGFARVVNTGSCLNVRLSPGTNAAILVCLSDGTLMRDTGETRNVGPDVWLRVITPNGAEGWVITTFLKR